jgi:heptosyltransferase-3
MNINFLKKLEISGKKLLHTLLKSLLNKSGNPDYDINQFRKILVFRLDQRLGNGILLLPLLNAIRKRLPDAELHLLIHGPVAEALGLYVDLKIDRFWPYRQKHLLSNPLRFLRWAISLRRQHYDLIISSHNPDNFSLSQAILGRWCNPQLLIGFDWKDNRDFYDVAVRSSAEKHYADAQLDLWRCFDPSAELKWIHFKVPESDSAGTEWPFKQRDISKRAAIFWLGSTGSKIFPPPLISPLAEIIKRSPDIQLFYALGPSDKKLLSRYPEWLRPEIVIWERPLIETIRLFTGFSLFVSADTGPMHIAVALGIPTLTIFSTSSVVQYGYSDGKKHFSLNYDGSDADKNKVLTSLQKLISNI